MTLLACGINHKSAPLEIREHMALSPMQYRDYLSAAVESDVIDEVAVVSTCNRTELYCSTTQSDDVVAWLAGRHEQAGMNVMEHVYIYRDHDAIRHMMRVASGLDSMVLGEPQILGQIKTAYQHATESGTIGRELGALFRAVFSATKRIRTDTSIGEYPVSMAYAGASLVKRLFADLSDLQVLMIGAGETTELTARHLAELGVKQFTVANRTLENAKLIAKQYGGRSITLADIPSVLPQMDIVITATASQLPILGKGAIETASQQRHHKPMLLIDLAMPRDIEAEAGSLPDVYLYNVDDLHTIIRDNLDERRDAAKKAEQIIEHELTKFLRWQRSLDAVAVIRRYRDDMREQSQLEIERAKRAIQTGEDADAVIEALGHRLMQKALHHPSKRLRKAGYDGRDDILKLAHYLFQPEEH